MNTLRIQFQWVLIALSTLGLISCGRLCQSPETAVPQSVTSIEWALRNTSDPTLKIGSHNLDNQNFIKMTFSPNYTGQSKQVIQNGELSPTPFVYDIPSSGILCMEGIPGTSQNSGNSNGATLRQLCRSGVSGVYRFSYKLSAKGLTLTDSEFPHYSYEFWVYKGAIAPDNLCTFK